MSRISDNREFVDFVTLVSNRSGDEPLQAKTSWRVAAVTWLKTRALMILIVIIPVCSACAYYGFIATDQFVSETQFVVRSPHHSSSGILSGFLQSTGFVRAQDDSYIVNEFIRSQAAMMKLVRNDDLIKILSRPDTDFLTRYPRPWTSPSKEALLKHYQDIIDIETDSSSGITTLKVRATRPEDARRLTNALLEYAEGLINRLNARARRDAVRYARSEVDESEHRLEQTQKAITDFRNREALLDPEKQSQAGLDLIARLSDQVAEDKARLAALEEQAPTSPQTQAIRSRIAATQHQISLERARIVGSDQSMAPRIAQYEQLLLERELAVKMLTSATTSLENAKMASQRQQLYLERIVPPNLPDESTYPKRMTSTLMFGLVCFAAYWILSFLIREAIKHGDPL